MRIIRKIIQWFFPPFKHRNSWEKYLIVSNPKTSKEQFEEIAEDFDGIHILSCYPYLYINNTNISEEVMLKSRAYKKFHHLI